MTERVNRIALVNPNGEVETISPDGTQHRILTQGDRFFQFPAWSPNGTRIAAVGGNRERAGVFVLEDEDLDLAFIQLREPRAVYESDSDAPIYLYWSPDSRHVSFLTARQHEDAMGLRVAPAGIDLETSQEFDRLVAIGRPCFWDWSADGKRILLHTGMNTDDDAQLKYVDPFNPASGHASIAKPGLFQAPGIARSGRYWAFAQVNRSGEMQLVVDGRADSNRMTVAHQGVAALSWSPTRDQLAYISPSEPVRTYYGPLRLLDAATGKVQMLTDDIVLAFFWSPNGRSIAYFTVASVAEQLWDTIMPEPDEAARDGGFRGHEDDDEEAEFDEARALRLNLWCVDVDDGDATATIG